MVDEIKPGPAQRIWSPRVTPHSARVGSGAEEVLLPLATIVGVLIHTLSEHNRMLLSRSAVSIERRDLRI